MRSVSKPELMSGGIRTEQWGEGAGVIDYQDTPQVHTQGTHGLG